MRVTRALEKLRIALARRGVVSTTADLSLMLSNEAAGAAPASLMASMAGIASVSAASTTPAVGLLHIMNTSKLAVSVATPIGIIVSGAGVYYVAHEARQIAQDQAATAAADGDLERIRSRLATATAHYNNLEENRVRLEKIRTGLRQTAKIAAGKGDSTASQAEIAQEIKALSKNPALEAASYRTNVRA